MITNFLNHHKMQIFEKEKLGNLEIKTEKGENFDILLSFDHSNSLRLYSELPNNKLDHICVHPSILPFYSFLNPLRSQVVQAEKFGGISLLQISNNNSKLLKQPIFSIPPQTNIHSFELCVSNLSALSVIQFLENLEIYKENARNLSNPEDSILVKDQVSLPLDLPSLLQLDGYIFKKFGFNLPTNTVVPPQSLTTREDQGCLNKYVDWNKDSSQVVGQWNATGKLTTIFYDHKKDLQREVSLNIIPFQTVGVRINESPGSFFLINNGENLAIKCRMGYLICDQLTMSGKKYDCKTFFYAFVATRGASEGKFTSSTDN